MGRRALLMGGGIAGASAGVANPAIPHRQPEAAFDLSIYSQRN